MKLSFAAYGELARSPIDVIQLQGNHFADPKPQPSKKDRTDDIFRKLTPVRWTATHCS